ncbi:hypothetical protein RIF23_16715 [Lipingzhangella sp. LS1_29]|uniref:Uncharacterized protein n=1 Tax=Lipingzhangella rawalii TaxID=2055835 RepID=A0ABU2HA91_9ACTN|nr:hypothetical protein [Lipingzhangella rawalii]MDS1271937.1 hypothetical protein [Lipingzhangella rawalii]
MSGSQWDPDPSAELRRRWGRSPQERAGASSGGNCPDIWELDNGDVAVIGQDLTTSHRYRLPRGVSIDPGESMVVIPRSALISAKPHIPDS